MPRIGFQSVGRSPPWTSVSSTPMSRLLRHPADVVERRAEPVDRAEHAGSISQTIYTSRTSECLHSASKADGSGKPRWCPELHSERPTRGHPARLGSRNPTFCSKRVRLGLLPISGRRPREPHEARAKLARPTVQSERPGLTAPTETTRSRFAACVRRFATRGCEREGLAGWARRGVPPVRWPTVAAISAVCLSEHRETSRPESCPVHGSRSRNARSHKQPRRFSRNPNGAEGAGRGNLGR